MIFTKMSTFTWDVIFRKTRMLYTFVIRSAFIYETTIWHTFKIKKTKIINKLMIIQNKCLRNIVEIFRVTFVSIFEIETHVFFIDLHLNQLQTHARYRMRVENMSLMIRRECDKLTHKLSTSLDRLRTHKKISDEFKRAWAKLQLFTNQRFSTNVVIVSWTNQTRLDFEHWKFHRQRKKNKRSSCRSLKAEMKDLLRHRVHVDFDSDREHRQKAFAIAQSIEKDRKLIIDSDSNRENWFRRLSVQTKDSRNNVDLVSMRLKQSND
jgi:hypothetical protein